VKVLAPAKINIYLRVLGKRPDRYHELSTIMVPISLADEITLEKTASGISLSAPGSGCFPEDNLAYRAAKLFLETTGISGGVSMEIVKNIPVGAGLGGGSSDASGVLLALNQLYAAGLGQRELASMAGKLGADCPFFIFRKAMLMGSRGDVPMEEVSLENRSFLIVIPPMSISTAEVYSKYSAPLTLEDDRIKIYRQKNLFIAPELWVLNDLESVVLDIYPELTNIRKDLIGAGALNAGMSGSGSAFFGIFESDSHLSGALSRLNRREGYNYIPTTRLTGDNYGDYRGEGISG
jgi:4-diphosphocytidyl-2-C-methyl-D-erythritol kinase